MKKKKIANIVMVAVIIGIAAAGIFAAGHIKGWFDKPDESTAVLTDYRGVITLQRDGVAYTTTDDTVLRESDKITCDPGASVKISLGNNYIVLGQNADVQIINPSVDSFVLKVNSGEAFANTDKLVTLRFEGREIQISNTVAALSVRKGTQSISVYYGTVGNAKEGQMLEWIGDNESVRDFSVKSLNDFNISQIRKANETKTLVFSNDELDELEQERFEQMYSASEMSTEGEMTSFYESSTAQVTTESKTTQASTENSAATDTVDSATIKEPATTKVHTTVEKTTVTEPATTKPKETTKPSQITQPTTDSEGISPIRPVEPETTTKPQTTTEPTTAKPTTTAKPVETTKEKLTCTITIRCDTILDNLENLEPAKAPYVPDNGVILREVTVEFEEGETVFDVLNRVCKQYNIPIEYSWTPLYDSYYIEGINNLYEFDCGSESGWMYKVNGWFPNYGCSSYYLTGGEKIVWCYTCNGLGEDVGAEKWE